MKREGNKILFDSPSQLTDFEDSLAMGQDEFQLALIKLLAKGQRERSRAWEKIKTQVDHLLESDETLSFDWINREIKVVKFDKTDEPSE